MLWVKAFHIIFVTTWFVGIFYLPRLFVYHAMSEDAPSIARFKVMERKLYFGIATPSAVLAVAFGLWLLAAYGWVTYKNMGWLHLKLTLALLLVAYHAYCAKLLADFKHDRNKRSHRWYRVFNEIPLLFLVAIVVLVVVKPF